MERLIGFEKNVITRNHTKNFVWSFVFYHVQKNDQHDRESTASSRRVLLQTRLLSKCEVLSTSERWNTPRVTYFMKYRELRSLETCRGSHMLRGFGHAGVLKHAVNHITRFSRTSEHWNTLRIGYCTRFRALWSIETRRESLYKVSSTSEHWITPRIKYFTMCRALRNIEARRL